MSELRVGVRDLKTRLSEYLRQLRVEWESFHPLPTTENAVMYGDALAVEDHLGGYDATHLAWALIGQEILGMLVTLFSFEGQWTEAARGVQIAYLPA